MLKLKELTIVPDRQALKAIPEGKVLINTINAYSYTITKTDQLFSEALQKGDFLIPDGASIVKACKWIGAKSQPRERIAGWDLFTIEMNRKEEQAIQSGKQKTVMFLGSSEQTLKKIREKAAHDFPHLAIKTFSPPYKPEFSDKENAEMVAAINNACPDLLWIGMTAPKQEKWLYTHWKQLNIHCHAGTIGAVFDFYAGNVKRAPRWWQEHSLEWLYRLLSEPKRMWKRYLIGNIKFIWYMMQEKQTKK